MRSTIRFATHVQESQVCANNNAHREAHTAASRLTQPCSVNAQVEFNCLILFTNLVRHLAGYSTTMRRKLFTALHFCRLFALFFYSRSINMMQDTLARKLLNAVQRCFVTVGKILTEGADLHPTSSVEHPIIQTQHLRLKRWVCAACAVAYVL